jgi:hypothetical protein
LDSRQADQDALLTSTHSLRYTLKNKETNTELFVVVIQLMPTDEAAQQQPEETHAEGQDSGDLD